MIELGSRRIDLLDQWPISTWPWSAKIRGVACVTRADRGDFGLPLATRLDLADLASIAEAAIIADSVPEMLRHLSLLSYLL